MIKRKQFVPASQKGRPIFWGIFLIALVTLFVLPVTRTPIKRAGAFIGMPVVRMVDGIGSWFSGIKTALTLKRSLVEENQMLAAHVEELEARLIERNALAKENAEFREMLNRPDSSGFTLAAVLVKPPRSLYGTLVIDGGAKAGFSKGDTVYAHGKTPIGYIESVMASSALVKLYSFPGEQFEARMSPSGLDITIIGRGGGNFSMTVPHGFEVAPETVVRTKEIDPHVIAVLEKIISDPRDPAQTLLLVSPVNIMELSFVEVVTQK